MKHGLLMASQQEAEKSDAGPLLLFSLPRVCVCVCVCSCVHTNIHAHTHSMQRAWHQGRHQQIQVTCCFSQTILSPAEHPSPAP